MDAKFATMLESQHVHTQTLIDVKSMFLKFFGGQKHPTKNYWDGTNCCF
jgi:hypothetical protein